MLPSSPAAVDLAKAQQSARIMPVYRRQCVFMCSSVEKHFSTYSDSEPETGQQWDDALANVIDCFAEWTELDVIYGFLDAEHILIGIEQLFNELKWCGLRIDESARDKARLQDEEGLRDILRKIVSSSSSLDFAVSPSQPTDRVLHLVKSLQNALADGTESPSMSARMEGALMFVYKQGNHSIPTPDLTSQVRNIENDPIVTSTLHRVYHADWIDHQQRIMIKSIKINHYNVESDKRFRRHVSNFYAASIHDKILRVYGMVLNSSLGCCLVHPSSATIPVLLYMDHIGDTSVLTFLSDVASALDHLHCFNPSIICGPICADNIFIKDDGVTACIADFGLLQLSDSTEWVNAFLRWCAPETIRAVQGVRRDSISSAFSKQTDVYAFGSIMFGEVGCLFTSERPFYQIEDSDSLQQEILHGTRPTMSNDLKAKASKRGFLTHTATLMKSCYETDPRLRPTASLLANSLLEQNQALASSPRRPGRRDTASSSSSSELMTMSPRSIYSSSSGSGSGSGQSSRSMGTASSGRTSSIRPLTPRSASLLQSPPQMMSFSPLPTESQPSVGLGHAVYQAIPENASSDYDQTILSSDNIESVSQSMSELTTDSTLRSNLPEFSFSDVTIQPNRRQAQSPDSYLGQRNNTAYERMPKLQGPIISTSRTNTKNRFELLTSRMTGHGKVNKNWVGVSDMEGLRGMTRSKGQLTQVSAIENLMRREGAFLADKTDEFIAHRLRTDPGILGIERIESFLSNVLEDNRTLRLINQSFWSALQDNWDVMSVGFTGFALVCKEAAMQFALIYPAYISHLPEIQGMINDEKSANERFRMILNETLSNGLTLGGALEQFLLAPVTHLEQHPRTLQLITSEMSSNHVEMGVLMEALDETTRAVNLVHLASWQRQESQEEKGWKDFVARESVKDVPKKEIQRQMCIFDLIAEEQRYVRSLKVMQAVLRNIIWELDSVTRTTDTRLLDVVKSLGAATAELLRFHDQLRKNLFTHQRAEHPVITSFVTKCGIDQVPWHSLYDYRFSAYYKKLSLMVHDGKVRVGFFTRFMQYPQSAGEDFMQFVLTPCVHLRQFVGFLKKIKSLCLPEDEDYEIISDIYPRLADVCQQVELKTSGSPERARLSAYAAALDFCLFSAVERDIEIDLPTRSLILSGPLHVGKFIGQNSRVSPEECFALLLDNFLIFSKKTEINGITRLEVCEKPIPLELLIIFIDGIPPYQADELLIPCLRLNHNEKSLFIYTDSDKTCGVWKTKIEEAQRMRADVQQQSRLIDYESVHKFGMEPFCSVEFVHGGELILLFACDYPNTGIWMQRGMKNVVQIVTTINNVSNMSVLEDSKIVLVLADAVLWWIRVEDIFKDKTARRHVDEAMSVDLYRAGMLAGRSFVLVLGKRKGKDVLRFFEVAGIGSPGKSIFNKKSGPFHVYSEVEIPYHIHIRDIVFLRNSFILITDAFQIVHFGDVQQLKLSLLSEPQVLPLPTDPLAELAERCRTSEPIGIHKSGTDFVLCYREFAAFVNASGQLSPKTIEWEVNDVTSVIFRQGHIFILGRSSIEIRQIAGGKLVQLVAIPGTIRLAWDRRADDETVHSLGLHVLICMDPNPVGPPNYWLSVEKGYPYAIYRACRR